MKIQQFPKEVVHILEDGGVGVLPTDTLYGLVGSALDKKTVQRIYVLRKRNPKKPMIILISSLRDLDFFDVKIDQEIKKFLKKVWPGKVSVVFGCKKERFKHLHRGQDSLAFRMPNEKPLLKLLKKTGPLVAPSANLEGRESAITIADAKKYFKDKVDFYLDLGKLKSKPSTLVQIKDGKIEILRKGSGKI